MLQLVWFLAPTVALCTQQNASINKKLPSLKTRLLTGLDSVELWSEQHIWDSVLAGKQVVVSTHAVLADALKHGFVKIAQLALLIFDEGTLAGTVPIEFHRLMGCSTPLRQRTSCKQDHAGFLSSSKG
jgi:ERCC4-related helicase